MQSLAILLLFAAPAPLPRPAIIESIVTAPGAPQRAAEQIRSIKSIERAFAHAFSPGEYRGKSPTWVQERLQVEVIRDGSALRITLSDCEPADAVAILDVLIQEHLCERIPKRKEIMTLLMKRVEDDRRRLRGGRIGEESEGTPLNSNKARAIFHQYVRAMSHSEKEEEAINLLRPCRVRGR
jgi:hypothetical protein